MTRCGVLLLLCLFLIGVTQAHAQNGPPKWDPVTEMQDYRGAGMTNAGAIEIPNGITLPVTCTVGDLFQDTDATTGSQLFACETTDNFVLQAGGGGGGGDDVSIDGVGVVDPDFVSTGDIDFVDTSNTVTANINAGVIVNADVNASAAIVMSKTALVGGTNITLSTNTLNVDDSFVINSGSDVMTGTLTADGLTLGANENITLGAQTLDHDGVTFVFSDVIIANGVTLSGGDSVSIDSLAVTDPDFVSTGDIDFVDTSNTITANINAGAIVNADVNASAAIVMSKTALVGGTNITLSTNTLNVDDAFLVNDGSDVMAGTLTADGLTLGANENITLGAQTLDHDGTTFVFSDEIVATVITAAPSATPSVSATDSDTTDEDVSTEIQSNCIVTTTAAENCNIAFRSQIGGVMTEAFRLDSTGGAHSLIFAADPILTTGDGSVTLLGSGGSNNEDITFDLETTANTVALSSSTGVDTFDFGTLDVETNGIITGGQFSSKNSTASFAVSVANALDAWHIVDNTGVVTVTLPTLSGADQTMEVCVYDRDGTNLLTVEVNAADIIILDGLDLDAGDTVDSSGTIGDYACFVGIDSSHWLLTHRKGVWVDGGP